MGQLRAEIQGENGLGSTRLAAISSICTRGPCSSYGTQNDAKSAWAQREETDIVCLVRRLGLLNRGSHLDQICPWEEPVRRSCGGDSREFRKIFGCLEGSCVVQCMTMTAIGRQGPEQPSARLRFSGSRLPHLCIDKPPSLRHRQLSHFSLLHINNLWSLHCDPSQVLAQHTTTRLRSSGL